MASRRGSGSDELHSALEASQHRSDKRQTKLEVLAEISWTRRFSNAKGIKQRVVGQKRASGRNPHPKGKGGEQHEPLVPLGMGAAAKTGTLAACKRAQVWVNLVSARAVVTGLPFQTIWIGFGPENF